MKKIIVALTGAALLLTGCSNTSGTATPAPTPTPTVATEAQVASVIAGSRSTFTEVYDNAGKCRVLWVQKGSDPTAILNRKSCYMNEVTAGIQAQTTIKELDALNVPSSMAPLVTETKAALQGLVDADLPASCGPITSEPNGSHECSLAQGKAYAAYVHLDPILAKWSPYL